MIILINSESDLSFSVNYRVFVSIHLEEYPVFTKFLVSKMRTPTFWTVRFEPAHYGNSRQLRQRPFCRPSRVVVEHWQKSVFSDNFVVFVNLWHGFHVSNSLLLIFPSSFTFTSWFLFTCTGFMSSQSTLDLDGVVRPIIEHWTREEDRWKTVRGFSTDRNENYLFC